MYIYIVVCCPFAWIVVPIDKPVFLALFYVKGFSYCFWLEDYASKEMDFVLPCPSVVVNIATRQPDFCSTRGMGDIRVWAKHSEQRNDGEKRHLAGVYCHEGKMGLRDTALIRLSHSHGNVIGAPGPSATQNVLLAGVCDWCSWTHCCWNSLTATVGRLGLQNTVFRKLYYSHRSVCGSPEHSPYDRVSNHSNIALHRRSVPHLCQRELF